MLKMQHNLEQYAHIPLKKRQNHSQNCLAQNKLEKAIVNLTCCYRLGMLANFHPSSAVNKLHGVFRVQTGK